MTLPFGFPRLGARVRHRIDATDDGYTMIELLTVSIIIGALAAIAIVTFLGQRGKSGDASASSDVRNLANIEESYLSSSNSSYGSATQLATQQRLPASTGDSVWVYTNGATGYCLVGHHMISSNYLVYDSQRGGLQSTRYTSLSAAQGACTSAGYTAAGTVTNPNGTVQTS